MELVFIMDYLGNNELHAIWLSVKVAFVSLIFLIPIGLLISHLLSRKEFYGRSFLDALVHLPLVLPPVVTGYFLLILFGRNGPIGKLFEYLFNFSFAFQWTGAVLAAFFMSLPLMVRSLRLSQDLINPKLEQVAGTLGAPPVRVYLTITVPLMLPGLVTGSILSFAKAMGEFGATITFVSNIPGRTQTIPSSIYSNLQVPGAETVVIYLVLVSATISIVSLLFSDWITKKICERIG